MIVGNSLEKIYWKGMLVFGGNGVGDENVEIPPYEIVEPTEPPTTGEPTNPPTNPPTGEPTNPPTSEPNDIYEISEGFRLYRKLQDGNIGDNILECVFPKNIGVRYESYNYASNNTGNTKYDYLRRSYIGLITSQDISEYTKIKIEVDKTILNDKITENMIFICNEPINYISTAKKYELNKWIDLTDDMLDNIVGSSGKKLVFFIWIYCKELFDTYKFNDLEWLEIKINSVKIYLGK